MQKLASDVVECSPSNPAQKEETEIATRTFSISTIGEIQNLIAKRGARSLIFGGGLIYPIIIVLIVWIGGYSFLKVEQQNTISYASQNTETIARGFSEQIRILASDLDRMLLIFREIIKDPDKQNSLGQITKSAAFREDLVLQIASMDENGILTDSNLGKPTVIVDLKDRMHFRIHKETTGDDLYIGDPLKGRVSGKSSIQFSRKIIGRNGEFKGVIVASVSPDKLSEYYKTMNVGDSGTITLFNNRSIILARSSENPEDEIGRDVSASASIKRFFRDGNYCTRAESSIDFLEKLICFQSVSGFPLGVAVAIPIQNVLGNLDNERSLLTYISIGVSLIAMFAFFFSLKRELKLYKTANNLEQIGEIANLRASQLESTLSSTDQGISMYDKHGNLVFENEHIRSLRSIYSQFREEIIKIVTRHERHTAGAFDGTALPAKGIIRLPLIGADCKHVELKWFLSKNDFVVLTVSDISDSVNARRSLESALRAERRSGESVKQFLAMMSHEIRTPLHTIIGFAALLRKTYLSGEQSHLLNFIIEPAQHLKSLIGDILDFTHLESGQVKLHHVQIKRSDFEQKGAALAKSLLGEKPLNFSQSFSDDMPATFVADEQRITQVLTNLLSNAIKYTSSGSVSLKFSFKAISDSSGKLTFEVSDTGVGMNEFEISRLFQPFTRGETVWNKQEGTGLGLAICSKIVSLMDGELNVKSQVGKGSVFSVTIPIKIEMESKSFALVHQESALPCYNILVAEDNGANRLLLVKMLENLGQKVVAVENGLEAALEIRNRQFDIVFLDIQMPVMDGVSAAREISADLAERSQNAVLVALTAQVAQIDRRMTLEAGFSDYLEKPIMEQELRSFISSFYQLQPKSNFFDARNSSL